VARPGSPLWKQVFDTVERRVGPALDELVKRDDVVTALVLAQRTRGEIDRRLERTSRRVLHLLNLPAGSDVNRLLAHIARLEREIGDLRSQLADRENAEFLAELEERYRAGLREGGGRGDRTESGDAARADPT
jgi:polyhydroxyalkanoate synthesis regulator phasin